MHNGALKLTEGLGDQDKVISSGETAEVVSLTAHKACMVLIDGKWVRDFDTYGPGDLTSFDSPREDAARK